MRDRRVSVPLEFARLTVAVAGAGAWVLVLWVVVRFWRVLAGIGRWLP